MDRRKLLDEHIEELKEDLIKEGVDPDSALGKQIVRLTRESIRQHNESVKVKEMTISTSIKDTDMFKRYLDLMKDILVDERVDKEIRKEYYQKYLKEIEK